MGVIVRRLELDDAVAEFDCRDGPLNTYLHKHAWNNQQKISIGITYVAVDEGAPKVVIGYFTLANASVPKEQFPVKYVRGLPPYDLPLVLLARLAVDHRFAGKGIGTILISHAFKTALSISEQSGCRAIIVDAYPSAIAWYQKYGFVAIEGAETGKTQKMFLDIRTVRKAMACARGS